MTVQSLAIGFTLNGRDVAAEVPANRLLIDLLRAPDGVGQRLGPQRNVQLFLRERRAPGALLRQRPIERVGQVVTGPGAHSVQPV